MNKKQITAKKRIEQILEKSKNEDLLILVINDTETTGTLFEDRIIQSAHSVFYINKNLDPDTMIFAHYIEEYVRPPLPIKPEAAAVHGIWEDEVFNDKVKPWQESVSSIELKLLSEAKNTYYIAHNSPFDIYMLRKEGIFWNTLNVIDTLLIARFLYKNEIDIKSKGLQYMRYFFNFDKMEDFKEIVKQHKVKKLIAHTALSDIVVLIYFFKFLLKNKLIKNIEQAVLLSSKPLLTDKVTFGKKFEKNSSLYNAICSRTPNNGLEYYNWAMINMDNLSIMDKMSISYFTIKAFRDKAIGLERLQKATPMIYVAASFIPETWDYLSSLGYNLNKLRADSLAKIEYNIKELENSDDMETKTRGFEKRKELNFLNNYALNFPNDIFSENQLL